MSKKKRVGLLALMMILGLVGWSRASVDEKTITVDGRERTYIVHAPKQSGPMPLVMCLHGGGGNARQMARIGMNELADREGFIVVYPNAWKKHWNDLRSDIDSPSVKDNVDDVAFLTAVLDEVSRAYPVDPGRVYFTGASNGAMMSHTFALKQADRVAAIAPVIGGLAEPLATDFHPSSPVSVLVIQGTEDPLVPYAGGPVARNRGRIVHTETAVALWRQAARCGPTAETVALPDRDPGDHCQATRTAWKGERADVELIVVEGGGHTWPGGRQYLPKKLVGRVCQDFSATETIWEFFKTRSK